MKKILLVLTVCLIVCSFVYAGVKQDIVSNKELTPSGTLIDVGNQIDVAGYERVGITMRTLGNGASGLTVRITPKVEGSDEKARFLEDTSGVFASKAYQYDTSTASDLTGSFVMQVDTEGAPYLQISAAATVSGYTTSLSIVDAKAYKIK